MSAEILTQIMSDIKEAMKNKDQERLLALRTLHADIKNVGINNRREVTDDDVVTVVAKAIKQRKESIAQFDAAHRSDLSKNEQKQIDIYTKY